MIKKFLNSVSMMLADIIKSICVAGLLTLVISILCLDFYGLLLFSFLYLIPAIVIYHVFYALKLKMYICDLLYLAAFIPFVLLSLKGGFIPDGDGWYHVPRMLTGLLFINFIAVYFKMIITRNRRIFNQIKDYKNLRSKISYGIKAALIFILVSVVSIHAAYKIDKREELKRQEEIKTFACQFINSAQNGTDFYKQILEKSLVHDINPYINIMTGNYWIGMDFSCADEAYMCGVHFDNGSILILLINPYSSPFTIYSIKRIN